MSSDVNALAEVRRFQSGVSYLREAPDPVASRITVHIVAASFLALAVLAAFGKVDRVVTSVSGKVVTERGSMMIQALDASIVRSLNVREGDRVRKGQVLATLDPTIAAADVSALRRQAASLRAGIARDTAELQGVALEFAQTEDLDQRHYNQMQADLFRERQALYSAQMRAYDEKIGGAQATLARLGNESGDLVEKANIARQVEGMRTTLLEKGAGSLLNQLDAKTARLEAQRLENSQRDSIAETRHQLSGLVAERDAFARSWASDLRKEMVSNQNALDGASAQLEKAELHKAQVELRAEEDAIILTSAKTSVGSILREGELIYSATPLNAPLVAEVHILARDIGFVRAGDPVTLKVDAFAFTEHGTAQGVVEWISEGAFFLNEETSQPVDAYYKARVKITEMNFIRVPAGFRLIPGMSLVADINVGRRSLGRYLIDGLIRGANEAMREP